MALELFLECNQMRLWEYTTSGFGESVRTGLRWRDVEAAAGWLGIPWSDHLRMKLAICQDVILEADAKKRASNTQ